MPQLTVEQALQIARQQHQAGQLAQAEALYRQVLQQQPDHADALHLLGVIAYQAGRHDSAVELIRRAVGVKPNYPEAYSNLGVALKEQGQLDAAIAACRQAIALNANLAEAHFNLGNALKARGKRDEAIAAYRQAIALKANYSEAHGNLGVALHDGMQLDEAIAAYRQAIARNPNLAEIHSNLGNALKDQGQLDAAAAAFRQAIALKPDYPEAYSNLGVALSEMGQLDEALAACRQAIALNPNYPEACSNLGNFLHAKGQLEEAIAAYRQAIGLKPNYPGAYSNLGNALRSQGQLEEAIAAYRQALALEPNLAEAHYNLGMVLKDGGQLDAGIAACRQAIALNPNFAEAYSDLGVSLQSKGQLDAALAAHRRAVGLAPNKAMIHSNLIFALHLHPAGDAQTLADEHRRWNVRHAAPWRGHIRHHMNDRIGDRRLKIGYVSPDFREHPVGRFLLPLLTHHDKSRFEVMAYAQVVVADAMTQRLRAYAAGWRSMVGLSDLQAADLIRQDGIDILVDLTMHTANNRLLIFARKPAPVQVTYLAYCSSTGLEAIDYRLSDPYLDPPGMDESVYSERTVRLPETYWCYQPVAAPEVNALPALAQGHITFGCLNNFCKVSEPTLAAWARLLRAVPNAQLLLHAREGTHRQSLREWFAGEGIEARRVGFAGYLPTEEYFASYGRIDVGLDTFPYGGGTTTCDALWMGVPVVSLVGNTAVGRGGLSILSNVGLGELAARSEEEYVRIAVELAGDLPRLSQLRSTLRQRMAQSPLMDAPRFARNVEAAYRQMWRRWCGGESSRDCQQ